jgi:asparagine synthase (glutamine-hydrolysing)
MMSVQFGKCNFDGKAIDRNDVDEVRPLLAPYGPDAEGCLSRGSAAILYRAFCTTKEARDEVQPHKSVSGRVITWDGRLDNREELVGQMDAKLSLASTDVEIVGAAYDHWDNGCFSKLVGDWALSIWNPHDQTVTLAKDFIGTRPLYYCAQSDGVTWCTILDPLVLFARHKFTLDEEYVAGWLSFLPADRLTPYVGIQAVPPSCFVRLGKNLRQTTRYWDFDPKRQTRYRNDVEYEEHFRQVFRESVRRRIRSDTPVLAELSGGMDSSSIVCMADAVIADGLAQSPRLDTVSYYDDSEPNWNERPYFGRIEEKRGRKGWHIDLRAEKSPKFLKENMPFAATPGSMTGLGTINRELRECLSSQGNRVVLSGIGGDEVVGGVPTPTQELADLIATSRLGSLATHLKLWALAQRRPWLHLLVEAIREFLPSALRGVPNFKQPPPWLASDFAYRHRAALRGYEKRLKLFGPLPSFQDNLATVDSMRRQIGCDCLSQDPLYETRYPFLDRSLLEFLFSIPREQLVRPGQRRSLMRRALAGIVPGEVLNRKRKAYVERAPLVTLSNEAAELIQKSGEMAITTAGILDASLFSSVLQNAREGHMVPMVTLIRTLNLESWLKAVLNCGLICTSADTARLPSWAGTERALVR